MRREWVLCTLLIGCVTHTTLPVPPSTLTAEQRIGWFNSLAGETEKTTTITTCQNLLSCQTRVERELRLSNGTTVEASEDLLPLVKPESATAQHAQAARHARDRGTNWEWGSLGAATGIVLVGSLAGHGQFGDDDTAFYVWGSAITVAAIGYLVGYISKAEAVEEDGIAFRAYTKDLADRLSICVLGYQLVPCEYRAPPPVTPTPSGPPGANEPPLEPPPPHGHVPDGPVARE